MSTITSLVVSNTDQVAMTLGLMTTTIWDLGAGRTNILTIIMAMVTVTPVIGTAKILTTR